MLDALPRADELRHTQEGDLLKMAQSLSRRRTLLLAAAALPLLAAGAARAATADATPSSSVSEVVVTATRQSEAISKVAESVSAYTAAKLEVLNVKSFADLAKFTPGVTFDQDRHDVSIRGIDSQAGSGTTGIYIDDTPIQARALGLNANNTLPVVFDLQRVEVLRGPQGTLFGAGSEGGTVRYITTQPSLTSFSANAHAEVAATENGAPSYEFGAATGGPIIEDKIGFRVSAWARRDGGWVDRNNSGDIGGIENDANHVDTYVLRGALTFAPLDNLTITPSINYENRHQHNHDEYWVGLSDPSAGNFVSGTPELMRDVDRFTLPALRIEWDAGPLRFISNTAYYDRLEHVNGYSGTLYNLSYFQHFTSNTDPDPFDDGTNAIPGLPPNPVDPQFNTPTGCGPAPTVSMPGCILGNLLTAKGLNLQGFGPYQSTNLTTNAQQNITQEFRVQSADSNARLTWTAGVFYAYNTQRSTEEIRDPQLPALTQYLWGEDMITAWGMDLLPNGDDYINDTQAHDQQIALFGDAAFRITEQLRLEVGLRYAWTHFDFHNLNNGAQDLLDSGGVPATSNGKQDETPFTPKVGLTYQLTPDDMVYGTYSQGYRIGGATPPLPIPACGPTPFPDQYNSDSVDSYEIGTKDRFLDNRLYVAASAFYVHWNNIQQAIYVPACGIQYTTNVGTAISQGFDLEGDWRLTDAFEVNLAVGYTDAHYTANAIDPNSGALLAVKGDVLDVAPWTVSLGAQYNFNLMNHDGFIRADYEYTDRRTRPIPAEDPATTYFDPGLVPDPATNLVSLRTGMSFQKVNLALYVDNLFDSHPQLDLQHQDGGTALFEATTFRPRTVGVSADYRF
jgi:iron complex outermembrane receptor protein